MTKEVLNKKYKGLLEQLKQLSSEDLISEKFNDFWAELISAFEWLSEEERKEILAKLKDKFNLETPDYNDQAT